MSKIDCSNIYNFMSEWERRRKAEPEEKWNELTGLKHFNPFGSSCLNEVVEKLQAWSDEHPKITRKEKFEKMCKENGFEDFNLCINENMPTIICKGNNCNDCIEYWNEEVDE